MKNIFVKYLSVTCLLLAIFSLSPKARAQTCALSITAPNDTATVVIGAQPAWWGYDYNGADNPSYLAATVITNNASLPDVYYNSWCIDTADSISGDLTTYTTTLYSSCDTNIDAELPANYPASVYVSLTNWHQINYILNHKNGAYFFNIQVAIWNLIGGPVPADHLVGPPLYPPLDTNQVNALLADAAANAANWQPSCGDVIAVIVAINSSPVSQLTIIEVPYPCIPCISVTKQVACLQPTNSCADFGKVAEGYAGVGCSGINQPAFCYQISVTNCGTIPLTNLVVSDNLLGILTTNFFSNALQVLQPGAGVSEVFSMSFSTNATNTVTVSGDVALAQTVTNLGTNQFVVTNGTPVSSSDYAVAVVDSAAVSCNVTLSSPNALGGNNGNSLVLPAASYYSTPNVVTLGVHVCNTGVASLTGVTINAPALTNFGCSMPAPFNLGPGGCQDFQLCIGVVTCPAQLNFNLTVTGQIVSDTNHCAIYDLTSTNLISVCSACSGSISCSTCTNGPANLSGTVLLHCNPANTSTNGDSGLAGVPVTLLGSTNNPLATNTTDINGNYTFINLAPGTYYVLVTVPTNYVETYPLGVTNNEITVVIASCSSVSNVDFGYASTLPPSISVVPGQYLGCNPTNLPTDISVSSNVTFIVSCGSASNSVTYADSTNNCTITRTFTIVVTDTYGNHASTNVIYTWTADTNVLSLKGVPTNAVLGCNPTNIPTVASVQAMVSANDTCSPATIHVTCVAATNNCAVTQIFTIIATNACGNSATAYVTNTWTADTTVLTLKGVPANALFGCNPTNLPTLASVQAMVSANDTCSPATIHVTGSTNTNGCTLTQIFTIVATNACGNSATASVTNTWTADTTVLALQGVPTGKNLGCNPTNVPTAASVQATVSANDTCSPATIHVTPSITTNNCLVTQLFTIIATNACGNSATAYVTNTWTADTTVLTLKGVPTNAVLGCNPTNVPTAASVQAMVSANDTCSPATIHVTPSITTNNCLVTQVFSIVATNACGNSATAYVTNTWTADTTILALKGVPTNAVFGCNPTNVPTAASVQAMVSANDTCSPASVHVTGSIATNNCAVTQIFTITATNACGNSVTAYVTNTWTASSTPPVISGLPVGSYLGCSPTNLPSDTNIYNDVSASGHCATVGIVVTHQDSTNGCTGMRTFLIVATDSCGNYASTNLTYTWNAGSGPIVVCPSNVIITTNVSKLCCTFTPWDWNTTHIGFNPTGCNNGNWNWTWWGNTWNNNYANNWWLAYCTTNSPTNCWPSWSNWWTTCNGTNPGTNWWDSWTNIGNGNHWSGCWTTLNGNWWNQWLGNTPRNQFWVPCGGNNPVDVLTNCFSTVYSNGCLRIGSTNGYCLSFTSPSAVQKCLGFTGAPGLFNCSATNPTSCNAGAFCSQVLALQLNCDFGDCTYEVPDFFGRCGDAVLCDPTSPCNGQTVRGILGICNTALGCGTLPQGCSLSYLCSLVTNLNQCFEGGQVSSWCITHLAPVYIPPPSQTGTATVTDACSPNPCVKYCDVVSNTACQGNYVISRTWTAVDACGHSNSCVQTITIQQGSSAGISGAVVLACSGDTNLSNNEGMTNVTVTLKNSGGSTVATTTTSTSGAYSFANLPAGTYTVVVTPPSGYTETVPSDTSNSQTVTLGGCQTLTGVSFGYTGSSPAVKIIKTGPCSIAHGQTACYSFAVTNTGNTCLSLKVNDPLLGGIIFTSSAVAPGQGFVFSSNYVVVQTNGCLTNTAWAIGTPPTGNSVSNQATTTAIITTKCITNTICGNFNSQNPGSGWVWCNAHISGNPGKKVTVFCQNASVTLTCSGGKTYTFPIPNGQINFSPTCSVGTNWFDGTQWNTTLPCGGDDGIFLQGCSIPWQTNFANCQSVCWTGIFSCDTAGFNCNWQWGAACYNDSQPSCGSIAPKACHQTYCPNGQYYSSGDQCGSPENHKPYCVGGATGGGGSNCTGSWSSTGSCSF